VVSLVDIVISLEKAKEQAEEYGHSFDREVAFLTVHSMLHLLGYDHMEEDEERDMRARQRVLMELLGLSVPSDGE
jgi:probable rRNA maturation factor